MRISVKITKSALINSILTTFLLLAIVSCGGSRKTSYSSRSKNVSPSTYSDKKSEHSNEKLNQVISTAKSYTGTRYKFGGTSRNGMDCSGLVYTSYKDAHIVLPRTSTEQSKAGKTVGLDDLQPGDLVFFTDKAGNRKITHVGMVTETKGRKNVKFIHASTKLGVVENDLYSEYYISIFIKAVRVF